MLEEIKSYYFDEKCIGKNEKYSSKEGVEQYPFPSVGPFFVSGRSYVEICSYNDKNNSYWSCEEEGKICYRHKDTYKSGSVQTTTKEYRSIDRLDESYDDKGNRSIDETLLRGFCGTFIIATEEHRKSSPSKHDNCSYDHEKFQELHNSDHASISPEILWTEEVVTCLKC